MLNNTKLINYNNTKEGEAMSVNQQFMISSAGARSIPTKSAGRCALPRTMWMPILPGHGMSILPDP